MKIFLSLMVFWCIGMATYLHIAEPEQTSAVVFWAMLALLNNQSLIMINQNQ